VYHPRCVCETRKRYVVKHNLITEPPHDHNATPAENNPAPPLPQIELLSSLYFMYFVLLLVSVMFHSVLSDPCFDSVCQAMCM